MTLALSTQVHDAVTVVRVAGRLDSTASPELEQSLGDALDRGARRMVIDFEGTDYISSAGLRVLLVVARRMEQRDGRLVLSALPPPVRQVFDLAGLLPLFSTASTLDDALAAAARP